MCGYTSSECDGLTCGTIVGTTLQDHRDVEAWMLFVKYAIELPFAGDWMLFLRYTNDLVFV